MADKITRERRSQNMRRIRSKGMKPEMIVRRLVHGMGFRYRLHRKGLPGKPDLVFGPRKKVIFVHGCFWHQHTDPACPIVRVPKSNLEYWKPKLDRNAERDRQNLEALQGIGWKVMIVWECQLRCQRALMERLRDFLGDSPKSAPRAAADSPPFKPPALKS